MNTATLLCSRQNIGRKNKLCVLEYQANDWKRQLDFYSSELRILSKRISESVFTDFDSMPAGIEEQQNRISELGKQIEQLKTELQGDIEQIEKYVRENITPVKSKMFITESQRISDIKNIAEIVIDTEYAINRMLASNL